MDSDYARELSAYHRITYEAIYLAGSFLLLSTFTEKVFILSLIAAIAMIPFGIFWIIACNFSGRVPICARGYTSIEFLTFLATPVMGVMVLIAGALANDFGQRRYYAHYSIRGWLRCYKGLAIHIQDHVRTHSLI